jgi:hypothetical protein
VAGLGGARQGKARLIRMNVCLVGAGYNRPQMNVFAEDLASRDIACYVSNSYADIDQCECVYIYNIDGCLEYDMAACIGYAIAKKKVIFSFLSLQHHGELGSFSYVDVCNPDELTNQAIFDAFVKNRIGEESSLT